MATFKCKDIVSLSANDLYEMDYAPKCPICGNGNYISFKPRIQNIKFAFVKFIYE